MKKLYMLLLLALPMCLAAQMPSGTVTYVEVIKMEWTPPADMDPAMKAQIEEMRKHMPKSFSHFRELNFDGDHAFYHISPKEAEKEENLNAGGENRGGGFRMMMGALDQEHYWDVKKSKYVEKRTFFGKEFLIKDEIKPLKWKIMGEAKEIMGHVCQKAVAEVDSSEIVAWFDMSIPAPVGPNGYGQLPGLILELELDKGRTTLTAESIDLKELDDKAIVEPKGGKVVTREEYNAIVKEKMDEMRQEWKSRSQGGGRMIHMSE